MVKELKTLLIDNGLESLDDYFRVFNLCDISVIPLSEVSNNSIDDFQLVILSDGHLVSAHKNYSEIDFIKSTRIPVIGICYGFQLLCVAHGAIIESLPEKREGLHQIDVLSTHPMFKGERSFNAVEKHRYAIKTVNNIPNLVCHASSIDGCEVVEVSGKNQFGFQFHPEINIDGNQGSSVLNGLLESIYPALFIEWIKIDLPE